MGLGKTVQSCSMLNYLYHEQQQYGPFIVIVPLSTLPAWQAQLATWAPDLNVIAYVGTGPSRQMIRDYEFGSAKKTKFNVLLTTYEFALKDQYDLNTIKWQYLMVDEVRSLLLASLDLSLIPFSPTGPSPQELRIGPLPSSRRLPRLRQAPHHRNAPSEQRQGAPRPHALPPPRAL